MRRQSAVPSLTALGLGERPGDPTSPPEMWKSIPVSAYTVVKANRAWHSMEHLPYGFGLRRVDADRLRAISMVVACAVYAWDGEAEADQAGGQDTDHHPHIDRLRALVESLGCGDQATMEEIEGIQRLFLLELAAARGELTGLDAWSELSAVRSADIRLQIRVLLSLMGREHKSLVHTVQPALEVAEVLDDLKSQADDLASGSFNTYWHLRRTMSGEETQRTLDQFAADQATLLLERLDALTDPEFRQAALTLHRPRSRQEFQVFQALSRLPRTVLMRLMGRYAENFIAGAFRRTWSEISVFREDRAAPVRE